MKKKYVKPKITKASKKSQEVFDKEIVAKFRAMSDRKILEFLNTPEFMKRVRNFLLK